MTKTLRILALVMVGMVGWAVGRAQQPPGADWSTPMIIHLSKLVAKDLPPKAPGKTFTYKILAATAGGTVQVQLGSVPKHFHSDANELQYIVSGGGKYWLGDKQETVGPGDLIIIPKGTVHGMLSEYKAIAVKSPPQAPTDMHPAP